MVDVMSTEKRSALMSRIRGKNTGPEIQIRKLLWRSGLRFRLQGSGLPGRPDIVLRRWRAVVFVHGCFWHHHDNCPLFRMPATRTDFWEAKLARNRQRDLETIKNLRKTDWRVAVVWECALKHNPDETGAALISWIRSESTGTELLKRGSSIMHVDLADPI
jgi:DNA mismatch endonuclease (patch repair protein)